MALGRIELLRPSTGRVGRRFLILGTLALAGASAWLTWWWTTLSGLPDIGDPFDVAAFAERPVQDDENAYTLYREAASLVGDQPEGDLKFDWPAAGPIEKGWLDRSREALEIWRRGTERPKSLYVPSRSLTILTPLSACQEIRKLMWLARLEAGRLESKGDLDGAWRWYRAIFRSSRHVGFHATAIERFVGLQMHDVACRQLTRWAKDPRVGPALLRQALDSAIGDYASTSPTSDTLKVEYLAFLKTYDDPDLVWKSLSDAEISGPGKPDWFARNLNVFSVVKVLKKEPERSRRVTRLIYANLLEVVDRPPGRRPEVACTLQGIFGGGPQAIVDLYRLDDSSPAKARALAPEEVERWFQSTVYARHLTPAFLNILKAIDREHATQAGLVIALANRLYELERGKPPETYEELVGPYLKTLPESYQQVR